MQSKIDQTSERPDDADVSSRKAENWHAKKVEECLDALDTSKEGLTQEAVEERLEREGENKFKKRRTDGLFHRIYNQLKSPIVLVLIGAFVLTLALGALVDAAVIAFALLIAIVVGVLQEGRASQAFEKLANSQSRSAIVLREGQRHEVDATELVHGDIVFLESGAAVPADVRLIDAKELSINEAALTGEWLPVGKDRGEAPIGAPFTEKFNMAWMGTFVVSGYGTGVVVATGGRTQVGELAESLGSIAREKTPLEVRMQRVSRIMLGVIGVLIAGIFVLGVVNGIPLEEMILTAVAVAVASIPEGLPAAVTIILAVAMESLLRRGGLVRNLLAAETLGSTTYVLTDKTGTLTKAQMAVTSLLLPAADGDVAVFQQKEWEDPAARHAFDMAVCGTNAYIETQDETDSFAIRGEPMERAVLEAAHQIGISLEGESARAKRFDYLSFTSENRFAAGLYAASDGTHLCVNGAPEHLLESATHAYVDGDVVSLTQAHRSALIAAIEQHTKRGERLMAVAYKPVDWDVISEAHAGAVCTDLVFVGLIAFHDPVREGVAESIAGVQDAGAHVRLVTGDNPNTARSVAETVGILTPDSEERVVLGTDIEEMDDETLFRTLQDVHVYARVLPKEKMRLARVLQERGETVAMTGDGINDAPALRKANIGVALGSGTEVAKESAALVLVNDSFSIIYAAIEEGRRVVSNLRKVVGYLLSTSLSEVALIAAALLVGAPVPLVPAQILWANVIEEGLMSFAFAFEPGEKRMMHRSPYELRAEEILSRRMLAFIGLVVLVTGGLLVALYFYVRSLGVPLSELRSVMFLAVAVDSLFIAISFRSLSLPFWKVDIKSNLFFLGSFAVSLGLLLVVLTVPFFQFLLSYEPLPARDMALIIGYGFMTLVTIEIAKWLFFERISRRT